MKKSRFYVLTLIIFVLLIGLFNKPTFSKTQNVVSANTSTDNYYFSVYEVIMDVGLDNSFVITENVKVHYNGAGPLGEGAHKGWVRVIPLKSEVKRKFTGDKKPTSMTYFYDISQVRCATNNVYDVYKRDGYLFIEFGTDDYVNLNGPVEILYSFSYMINVGYDMNPKADELYFNLHGTQHSVGTEIFKFTVNMPNSEFDVNNIEFFKGEYGESSTPADIRYDVNGSTISNNQAYLDYENGVEDHGLFSLLPHVGLTLRIELPEGYFSKVDKSMFNKAFDYGLIAVLVLVTVGIIVICLMVSGKNKPVVTVEFYPPDDITPPDATYIANGTLSSKRMTSLLLYWASKNYVKIELDGVNNPHAITKLRDLPEHAKQFEKTIFTELFKYSNTYELQKYDISLSNAFNSGVSFVKELNGPRYTSKSKGLLILTGLLSFLPLALLSVLCFALRQPHLKGFMFAEFLTVFVCLAPVFCLKLVSKMCFSKWKKFGIKVVQVLILALMITVTCLIIPAYLDVFYLQYFIYIPVLLFCIFGVDIFNLDCCLLQFTGKTKVVYGKLMGLKNNIVKVDYDKIKKLVEKDPSYFYDVLPYAYALGVMDDFVKKFEGLAITPNPSYGSMDIFAIHIMCNSLNKNVATSIVAPASTRSGGGFGGGGGGFSGGGMGGGGSFGR